MMAIEYQYLGYGVLVLFVGLWLWERLGDGLDGREPPLVRSRIPMLGHLLGMLRFQIEYLEMLSTKYASWPCLTLKVLGGRTYIISDASLVQLALRNVKTLSFEPFIVQTTARMFNLSNRAKKILEHTAPEGEPTYITEIHHSMYTPLGVGPALYEMNARALESLGGFLDEVGTEEVRKELFGWIRDSFTEASAQALYGPRNPITEDRSLINSLWDFENDLNWLMVGILPQLTAPAAYKGRARIQKAFSKYYSRGDEVHAAGFIKSRNITGRKWGFTEQDIADFELSMIFVSTVNTVPSGFWLICYIFSDAQLLEQIREEVETIVTRKVVDGEERLVMDISLFEKSTPLLVSAYREVFRLINSGASVRFVLDDTLLDNKYLLKKGSIVQMPAGPLHQSEDIWGPTAHEFDAYRFLGSRKDELSKEEKKKQTQGYFPFGGGRHLCPGRHFAFTEIVGLAATLVYGFEVRMADGTKGVRLPEMGGKKFGASIRKPVADVEMLIRKRKGLEGLKWAYEFGGLDKGE